MPKREPPPNFRKLLERLAYSRQNSEVFSSFCRFAACAVAMQTREEEYFEEMKRWKTDDMQLFAQALAALTMEMQQKPFEDILGAHYMEWALCSKGQQWHGEFHTPQSICEMMARLTIGDVESLPQDRPITVCEPACGSGAMILGVGKVVPPDVRRRLRVTAIDINRTACDMCFINTTLWGIPTRVIWGNTISMELWKGWSNIHYIMPWLPLCLRPRERTNTDQTPPLLPPLPANQGEPPSKAETETIRRSLHQQELQLV